MAKKPTITEVVESCEQTLKVIRDSKVGRNGQEKWRAVPKYAALFEALVPTLLKELQKR